MPKLFSPKDEVFVREILFFFCCFHPKGEEKSLRKKSFLGGIAGWRLRSGGKC
jgi:hypothetical protein